MNEYLEKHSFRERFITEAPSADTYLIVVIPCHDEPDLITTLQVAIGTMVVLFAMIAQNDDGTGRYRTLGLLVGQAIPLTIILFLFFLLNFQFFC